MKKDIVLCDIDGTIADIQHRLYHITGKKKYWDLFYNDCSGDKPIKKIIRVVQYLRDSGMTIIFVTGRSEQADFETMKWLLKYFGEFDYLLMRKIGDHRPDHEVKPELVAQSCIDLRRVLCVFEDRKQMVDKWRELGLATMQVADGDF